MYVREDVGRIAVLRLAHGKVSALDVAFCDALVKELTDLAHGPSQALVLTGTGSTFSAGVDLFQVLEGGAAYLGRLLPAMESLLKTLLIWPKPVVAAVNGHAIAGGCIMAAACDHRMMATGSGRIGVPELLVGVPFPQLPFEICAACFGASTLRSLIYSGRTVLAEDAVALGMIDETAAPEALLQQARAAAERLAEIPATTFALTKRTLTMPILERVRAAAALDAEVRHAWASADVHSRIRQYLEKTIAKSR